MTVRTDKRRLVMTNIFLVSGTRNSDVSLFVAGFYELLMTRRPVSYADVIYHTDSNIPVGYFRNHKLSSYERYSSLKKAVSIVHNEFSIRFPGSLVDNGKHKGKSFQYVGEIDDPLAEDRKHFRQQTVEDYVRFCKGAVGLLPTGWFSAFFEGTNLLLDTKRDAEAGNMIVGSAHDLKLLNIHLLPVLYKAITDHLVIRFDYKPYDKDSISVVLHPQYLKEYNGRWFILGQVADESLEVKSVPVDRIHSEITTADNIDYLEAPAGYYREYFKDIIGVMHTKNRKAFDIVIRTHSAYHHGLVTTKPLHNSQEELVPYGRHEDGEYGEIRIQVEPTVELVGRIISLGANLEVVSPSEVRQQVAETVAGLAARYATQER